MVAVLGKEQDESFDAVFHVVRKRAAALPLTRSSVAERRGQKQVLWKWTNFLKGKKIKAGFSGGHLDECVNSPGVNVFRLQKDVASGCSSL